jgi:hypothetical protein
MNAEEKKKVRIDYDEKRRGLFDWQTRTLREILELSDDAREALQTITNGDLWGDPTTAEMGRNDLRRAHAKMDAISRAIEGREAVPPVPQPTEPGGCEGGGSGGAAGVDRDGAGGLGDGRGGAAWK